MTFSANADKRLLFPSLLVAGLLVVGCLTDTRDAALIGLGAIAGAAFLLSTFRWPYVLLVAAIYVPQWKETWPANGIKFVDLTLVALAGLLIGILWRLLGYAVDKSNRVNTATIFRGQWGTLLAYGAFCVVVASSYFYTDSPQYGATKLLRLTLIGTLLLLSGLILIRDEVDFRRFSIFFVLSGCITSLQMVLHLEDRAATAEGDITRIGAGWLLGMAILLLVCFPLLRRSKQQTLFVCVCLPILIAGLVASAARGPAVGLALLLPLTFFVFARQRLSGVRTAMAFLLIVCCCGSYLYLRRADPEKYGAKLSELVRMSEGAKTSGSATKRLEFYQRTVRAVPDNLWFGKGVGSWSFFYFGRDERAYPHNLFLEIAFEEGLIGLSVLFMFLTILGRSAFCVVRSTRFRYGVLPGLVLYCLFISMFSGDLDDNRILWVWAGITMAIYRNLITQSSLSPRAVHIRQPTRRLFLRPQTVTLKSSDPVSPV